MAMLVLNGSFREQGNTRLLAERVVRDLPHRSIQIRDVTILPLVDYRHDPQGFPASHDDFDSIMEEVLAHDLLLVATPLYWYGLPGPLKTFFDRWSEAMRRPQWHFRERMSQKKAYAVIVGGDNPRIQALPLVLQLKHIFDYAGADFAGYVIGKGNRPGEVLTDERALYEADWLNQQLRSMVLEQRSN